MRRIAWVVLAASVALALAGPASAASPGKISGGTLTLTGSGRGEKVVLQLKKGTPGTLQVDVRANGSADLSFARKKFSRIVVVAGGGNDAVTISDKYGAFTNQESTKILGGPGNDKLTGGAGAEVFTGGPGADTASGKGGGDEFLWSPGSGSDKIDGGARRRYAVRKRLGRRRHVSRQPKLAAPGRFRPGFRPERRHGREGEHRRSRRKRHDHRRRRGGAHEARPGRRPGRRHAERRQRRRRPDGGIDADQVDGNGGGDTAGLGDGNDVFVWNPGDGNDVIEGDAGADTLSFAGDSDNEVFTASSTEPGWPSLARSRA